MVALLAFLVALEDADVLLLGRIVAEVEEELALLAGAGVVKLLAVIFTIVLLMLRVEHFVFSLVEVVGQRREHDLLAQVPGHSRL